MNEKKQSFHLMQTEQFANFASSIISILIGLLVGFIILLCSNPSKAGSGFLAILGGGFSSMQDLGQVFYFATPLILTGLSVGFSNKTGLFNIGGPGQFIVGAYAAVYAGVQWTAIPGALHWIVCLLMAILAGAVWGLIPGLLKAYCNVNVVISCIMMNYVGMYMVNLLVTSTIFDSTTNQSLPVEDSAVCPKWGLDKIFRTGNSSSSVNSGFVLAIVTCIIIYILINKTEFGFELKACGYNSDACRYAGMSEKRNVMLTMAISGALSALGGAFLYLAGSGKGIEVVEVLAQQGFDGIPVALLGLNNPIGILFSGIFIAYLKVGGNKMQLFNFVPEVVDIIVSVIIYFSALALLFKGIVQKLANRRHIDKQDRNSGNTGLKETSSTLEGGTKV